MSAGRLRLVVAGFGVAALVLGGRLAQLQWLGAASLSERAARQRVYVETVPARPGEIVDRTGRLLAITLKAPSLYAVPRSIRDPQEFAAAVGPAAGVEADKLAADLARNADRSFLWIRRRLAPDQADAVRRLKLPRGSWGLRDEYVRRYPQGTLAAHVLGLRDIDGVGRGGVEQRFDRLLRGDDGRRVVLRDARGRAVDVRDELTDPPVPGRTLVLTLDAIVQLDAERALDRLMAEHRPLGACALVADVKTAELLAVVSRPTFDPNDPAAAAPEAWPNRAVTAVYEPGSTFKPLVVAWATDVGLLAPDERIDCEGGTYRSGRRVLHDHHGYGELSVTDILVKSSNIGMAKIGERLGIEGLHRCVTAFGFGRPTGVPLPGEQAGVVRPLDRWNDYSVGSVPMGHEIAVTPLQLLTAHVALANGGKLVSPRLVLRDVDPILSGEKEPRTDRYAQVTSKVVAPEVARWVVGEAMTEVVRRGTGKAARLDGYTVFGKTGTAQKFDAAAGQFSNERHVVSFVAGAPADDPKVLVLVMVDEPAGAEQAGGTVAAPAAAEILRRTLLHLGVPYDRPAEVAGRPGTLR
jgi:cell division protein FtsI/penicillin-binding protein 2